MSRRKQLIGEIHRRSLWQVLSILLPFAAFLAACSHKAPISTGIEIQQSAEDGVPPQRVALLAFGFLWGKEEPRDLCSWESWGKFLCYPEGSDGSFWWFKGWRGWVPQEILRRALPVSVLSAIDLNNDDVEEWYARYGEQYSRSVEAMIRGRSREEVDEAIEFIGRVYRVDHLLVLQRAEGRRWRTDGEDFFRSDSLKADLYRVETKQRVWSATVTAEIGPYDHIGSCGSRDGNPYDLGCAFGSYKEAPSWEAVWQVLAEELAANFPYRQASQR